MEQDLGKLETVGRVSKIIFLQSDFFETKDDVKMSRWIGYDCYGTTISLSIRINNELNWIMAILGTKSISPGFIHQVSCLSLALFLKYLFVEKTIMAELGESNPWTVNYHNTGSCHSLCICSGENDNFLDNLSSGGRLRYFLLITNFC